MKISADGVNSLARSDYHKRGSAFVPSDGSFAAILNEGMGGLRYDAAATGPVRSFQEMPIVAPSSVEYVADKPQAVQRDMRASAGAPASDESAASSATFLTVETQRQNLAGPPVAIPGVANQARILNFTDSRVPQMSANPMPGPLIAHAEGHDMKMARVGQKAFAAWLSHNLPFSAHVVKSGAGVKINIRSATLSDEDVTDLRTAILSLASSHGVSVEQIYISSHGKAG